MNLKDRVALVTGASRGIGAATAEVLARRGAQVALSARTRSDLEQVAGRIRDAGGRALIVPCDALDYAAIEAAMDTVVRHWRRVDILVNNAGLGTPTMPVETIPLSDWDQTVALNLKAPFLFIRAAAPVMKRQGYGRIANVSSIAGFLVGPKSATYCATKGYITSFTESLYLELAGSGVRLQALCPGYTRSDFHARMGMDTSGEFFRHFMSADDVVKASLKAIEKGTVVCIPGFRYKLIALAARFIPRKLYYWLANRTQGTRLRRVE